LFISSPDLKVGVKKLDMLNIIVGEIYNPEIKEILPFGQDDKMTK